MKHLTIILAFRQLLYMSKVLIFTGQAEAGLNRAGQRVTRKFRGPDQVRPPSVRLERRVRTPQLATG